MASHLSPPSNDEINGYAFNGSSTIMQKVRHARQKKLAGIMIWETGQDDPREEFSLLKAIGRQSGRESSAGPR